MMSIKCGRCTGRHEDVSAVRACYNGQVVSRGTQPPASSVASPKQVKYLTGLLRQFYMCLASKVAPDAMPYAEFRVLLDGMIAYRDRRGNAPLPRGVRMDSGRMSADGNPDGYGDPVPAAPEPYPDVPAPN